METNYWLEDVRITNESGPQVHACRPLRCNVSPSGERVPSLPLVNQDGKTIHLDDFKGKAVLLTFVYTRCPMPNFLPPAPQAVPQDSRRLGVNSWTYIAKTHLLTVSFDPKYDTAPVLRRYGLAYLDNDASGFAHWDFASAAPADLAQAGQRVRTDRISEQGESDCPLDGHRVDFTTRDHRQVLVH